MLDPVAACSPRRSAKASRAIRPCTPLFLPGSRCDTCGSCGRTGGFPSRKVAAAADGPNIRGMHVEPLILTLRLEPAAFEALDALRRRHFPPERNFIPAHVTLFHALPSEEEAGIRAHLGVLCATVAPLRLTFTAARFLGRGVALEVNCPELVALHRELAETWRPWLNAQDRQGYRPHLTIQNKVDAATARALHAALTADWRPMPALADGLLLWHYLGGPWKLAAAFPFAGAGRQARRVAAACHRNGPATLDSTCRGE